jgi:hypothetical protein
MDKQSFLLNPLFSKEAICFKDQTTLLIADEKTKKIGGYVCAVTFEQLSPTLNQMCSGFIILLFK